MKFDKSDPVRCFQSAALNQYAFDEFYYNLLGLKIYEFKGIPRPAKWAVKYIKILPYIKRVSSFILLFWVYCGFYINLFLQFTSCVIFRNKSNIDVCKNSTVGIIVCERSFQVLSRNDIGSVDVWLCTDCDINTNGKHINKISNKNILNLKELTECVALSIKVHIEITKYKNKYLSFQSYAVMSWMMTWFTLIKLKPSKIYTSEHHDRWAVLIDSYVGLSSTQQKCNFSLVQHGKEYEQTYVKMEEISAEEGLPYRLRNVNKLYLYDKNQLMIFKDRILSKSNCVDLEVIYISAKLGLVALDLEVKSILIVGHSFCEAIHTKLYQDFLKFKKFKVFYKPHPTVIASNFAKSLAWEYIEDKNYFPRVDLVISYPSTLVDEYEAEGVKVIVHDFNINCIVDLKCQINSALSV